VGVSLRMVESVPFRLEHKDYNPWRQGIAVCRNPGGICLCDVALRLTFYPPHDTSPPGSPRLPGVLGASIMMIRVAPSWGVGLERNEP